MTDKEMLEAMRSMLEAERDNTRQMIQEENASIKADISKLEQGQAKLAQEVVKIGIVQENITNKTLKLIQEGMAGVNEKFHRLDNLEAKQENHGHRIFALEQVLKKA